MSGPEDKVKRMKTSRLPTQGIGHRIHVVNLKCNKFVLASYEVEDHSFCIVINGNNGRKN